MAHFLCDSPAIPAAGTGQRSVRCPVSIMAKSDKAGSEQEMDKRVARAVELVDRLEAEKARDKAFDEEREIAKARAAGLTKRRWWRLGR